MKHSNQYDWNVTRKFSWGHIVAFVALIFMSYVMYMGVFYSNGGDFIKAALAVAGIDVLILGVFIGAQLFKGTDTKFDRCIIFERILICLCPVVFVLAMMSYNHFWGVYGQRQEIEKQFNEAIAKSGSMFDEYDQYVDERLDNYSKRLGRLRSAGVITGNQQQNYYLTLQLQLRNKDQQQIEEQARKWIEKANTGASVWNAFLIGNLNQISTAVKGWEETLDEYSRPMLSNELAEPKEAELAKVPKTPGSKSGYNTGKKQQNKYPEHNSKTFREKSGTGTKESQSPGYTYLSINENGFDWEEEKILSFSEVRSAGGLREDLFAELQKKYSEDKGLQFNTIWTGLILFAMLLFPYLLQRRNTRAHGYYHLLPARNNAHRPRQGAYPNRNYYDGNVHMPPLPGSGACPSNGQQYPPKQNYGGDSDIYSGTM